MIVSRMKMCLGYLNFIKSITLEFTFFFTFSICLHHFIFKYPSLFLSILQNQSQQCGSVIFHSFDPVIVRLSLDSTNIQHEKLTFELLKPYIEGFSIQLSDKMDIDNAPQEQSSDATKRKSKESQPSKKVSKKKKSKWEIFFFVKN